LRHTGQLETKAELREHYEKASTSNKTRQHGRGEKANGQVSHQIRSQMSAFFFTASSRPRLDRRLRRRLGGDDVAIPSGSAGKRPFQLDKIT
jgi:hypothetical protein